MTQLSFADTGFECSRKYTHTEAFPETMLAAISWASLSTILYSMRRGQRLVPRIPVTCDAAIPLSAAVVCPQ